MSNAYLVQVVTAMPILSAFQNIGAAVETMQQRLVPPLYALGIRDVFVRTENPLTYGPVFVSPVNNESHFDVEVPFMEWAEGMVAPVYPEFDDSDAFNLVTAVRTQHTHEWYKRYESIPPWGKAIDDIMQKAAWTSPILPAREGSNLISDVASARKSVEPLENHVRRRGHVLGVAALNDETPMRRMRIVRDVVNSRFDDGYGPQMGAEILYGTGKAGRLVLLPGGGFDISSEHFLKAVNPLRGKEEDLALATMKDDRREGAFSAQFHTLHNRSWKKSLRDLMFLGVILAELPQFVRTSTFPWRETSNDSTFPGEVMPAGPGNETSAHAA